VLHKVRKKLGDEISDGVRPEALSANFLAKGRRGS
jgi:hypothetical protein